MTVPSTLAAIEVRSHGATDGIWLAQTTARIMLGALSDDHLARVMTTSTVVDIIPRDRKLTEIPGLRRLGGQTTHDGRTWETVRGVHAHWRGGVRHVAVGVEALDGVNTGYLPLFVMVHELAHALYWTALRVDQRATVEAQYAANRRTGTFVDAYAGSTVAEYFAQCVSAYFGVPVGRREITPFTPAWLQSNDPVMFNLLSTTFSNWPTERINQPRWWVSRVLELSGRPAVAGPGLGPRVRRDTWPDLGCLATDAGGFTV